MHPAAPAGNVADKTCMSAETHANIVPAAALKPEAAPSGAGYRATVSRDGPVMWLCRHVHFTDHSARACAERYLREVAGRL